MIKEGSTWCVILHPSLIPQGLQYDNQGFATDAGNTVET